MERTTRSPALVVELVKHKSHFPSGRGELRHSHATAPFACLLLNCVSVSSCSCLISMSPRPHVGR